MYYLTPIKKNEYGQYDRETLEIFEDGRVVCSCKHNLWHKDRDYCSICSHATKFIEDLGNNNLEDYIYVEE